MRSVYKYPDGSVYDGEWNEQGQRHGIGNMKFADGTIYFGPFDLGFCNGCGTMDFSDGSKYEGDFQNGKFGGFGVFKRCDGMKFEGQFRDGKIWGQGIITFADGTHGLPRNEGNFEGNKLVKREKCPAAINKARKSADLARQATTS